MISPSECFENHRKDSLKCLIQDERRMNGLYCECCSIVDNGSDCITQEAGGLPYQKEFHSINSHLDPKNIFAKLYSNCTSNGNHKFFIKVVKNNPDSIIYGCIDDDNKEINLHTVNSHNFWDVFEHKNSPLLHETKLIPLWFFILFFLISIIFLIGSVIYLCSVKHKRIRKGNKYDPRFRSFVSRYKFDDDLKTLI